MAAAAEGGARPPEGPPAERGRHSDTDSDETVVEGSVTESDVEEEEFHRRRLAFLNEDVALTTEISINKGTFSPEISFVQKYGGHKYYDKAEQINPVLQETDISDQSQSVLKGWINHSSPTENISKTCFSLNCAAEEQQNNSVGINLNGFQRDLEEKISRKLSNKDCCPEISLCRHDPVEDITVQEEQILEDTFPHGLDNCHRTCMTIIDTDNTVKEHSFNNDTDLSLSSLGKIFMDVFTEQNIETSEVDISDLLRYPSDSESLKVENPLPDKLECQGHSCSVNPSAAESNDALPVELVAPLNALSASMVQAATPVVPNERQLNAKKEQLNSETSVLQVDDDYTQITNVMEPQLATIQAEEINAFTGSNLQSTTNEQPVGGQQREEEVMSDYLDATFSEKQTGEGHSYSVEPAACAETAQTTSSLVSKSTSEDKQDFESIIWQEIMLNEYAKANQRRRSKRIDEKQRREAFGRNSINPACPLSLSTIHRKNVYGENLLHRAVIHQDINLVHRIIKAGGNVNAQDYAGLTALHIASVEGFYRIANLLLKAGADVNATQKEQITPLQDAVKEGHYEVVNLLLWYGADPLLKNQMGRCALEEASDPSMMKLIKSYLAKSRRHSKAGGDDSKNMLNTQCVEDTNQRQTEELEPACANPQKTSQKAKSASYSSSSNKKLSSNQSKLRQASEQQTSKKSVSTREKAAIVYGTCKTRVGRNTKTRRNGKGETQLHIAAKRGDVSLVKTLISSGISVNEQDYAGWTAIHEASNGGFTDVIVELLKAGADVNSRSFCGVLPIHDAVSGNYLEAARILLQHGANPNERDGSGESPLNQACDEEMKDLLKSYGAVDSVLPVQTVEVTDCGEGKSKHHCNDCYKNDDAVLETQHEKYSVESAAAIQDTEKKQEELLLFELRTWKDSDVYIQRLSQIQDTLNEILANQKTERDALAKKYRASVESFQKGVLRKQLVNLASRQKSLLTVAQNQEKLVQKIKNYRKTKQMFSSSSDKQISKLVTFHGSDTRESLTANEIMCTNTVTFTMGLGASTPNGNRVEAHVSLENRLSAQECIQHPHICLDEKGANKEAITSKEASDHALASENRVRESAFDMSKLTNAAEVMTLPSKPTISTAKTKCSQQKDIDRIVIVGQKNRFLKPISITNSLNTVEPQSTVVSKNVSQTTNDCKQVLSHQDLHRYVNKKEAVQQQQQPQQEILIASTKNFSNTLQQRVFQSSENSFNANLMLTNLSSNTDSLANISEKSSQSYDNQEWEQKQVRYGWKSKKKYQLIDLLELGRIKPGENVLEFKLQEFTHKATLLKNGKIRTSKGQILQNPVQWVKDLLGSDISVTWKYVWNKVTYLGTELSKFGVDEASFSSDLELPTQKANPFGSSVQFNSVESLTHFLQFHEIVMAHKEEFLPCSAMEKHWSFYKECKDFGF
uniref:ankyrin repeat domain-containing protein 31 n=1 Tax=Lonchura striata TaxID=40157 RepID=UPI0012939E8E|nr:ankyrin repeat domain-containing protein 31 [Lonchura striata domestica]